MIHVCAAVIREKGRILVSSRPAGKAAAGKWEFPGGKMEPGETPGECIVREMKEELGVEVIPLDTIFDFVHFYPAGAVHLNFIRCVRKEGSEPVAKEGQEFRWAALDELCEMDFVEADIPLCALLRPERTSV